MGDKQFGFTDYEQNRAKSCALAEAIGKAWRSHLKVAHPFWVIKQAWGLETSRLERPGCGLWRTPLQKQRTGRTQEPFPGVSSATGSHLIGEFVRPFG
jgi:hypothetical protein